MFVFCDLPPPAPQYQQATQKQGQLYVLDKVLLPSALFNSTVETSVGGGTTFLKRSNDAAC